MRLLFTAIILTLLSQSAWADIRKLETQNLGEWEFSTQTLCVDGYKFVVGNRVRDKQVGGLRDPSQIISDLTMVQFYENKDGVALPAKC